VSEPQPEKAAETPREENGPVVVKKYANRRLYNTATSAYVTLEYLADMVKGGEDFVVYDAKTGEDITRSVLTQIIFEEENKGQNLLPIQFLRQLIKFYGDSLQSFVPSYLELSMAAFARDRERLRAQMRETFGAMPGYKMLEETARQNMALFDQAMKLFVPALFQQTAPKSADESEDIAALKAQVAALQRQIDKLDKS
jgi:polyhydroxyalkanoate synthesis repressor PhaR